MKGDFLIEVLSPRGEIESSHREPAPRVPDLKRILTSALEKAIKSPDVGTVHHQLGALVDYKAADELKRIMQEDYDMAKQLLKAGN